jgi:hypothetical protein
MTVSTDEAVATAARSVRPYRQIRAQGQRICYVRSPRLEDQAPNGSSASVTPCAYDASGTSGRDVA